MHRNVLDLCVAFALCTSSGCSLIVAEQVEALPERPDAGVIGGPVCATTQDCLSIGVLQNDCTQRCVFGAGTEGRCMDTAEAAPDGTTCGGTNERICVAGECVDRGCGDGFVDRAPPTGEPEYCDDGNDSDCDLCNNSCTKYCSHPALPSCNDFPDDGCRGGADTCQTGGQTECSSFGAAPGSPVPVSVCLPATAAPDGTECMDGAGRCVSGHCVTE
jgi:hypothetical protein